VPVGLLKAKRYNKMKIEHLRIVLHLQREIRKMAPSLMLENYEHKIRL
jgi:hypothetical protein